jgi:hypothetical protein
MRSTLKPSMRARAGARGCSLRIASAAARVASGPIRSSTTPPKSVLCGMSGETIFSATAAADARRRRSRPARVWRPGTTSITANP